MTELMTQDYLIEDDEFQGGIQRLYKFDNGYGASVIRHPGSYGFTQNLWELAVIRYDEEPRFYLDYSTEITDDVIGYLTESEVNSYLLRIKNLKEQS